MRQAAPLANTDAQAVPADRPPSDRKRLLLLCYLCSPERGSEWGVGWNRALQAAQHYDAWVLTSDRPESREEIERYAREHGRIPGLTFVFLPATPWMRRLQSIPGCRYLAYRAWHRSAYRIARRLDERLRFHLAHQVNYCGYREPGYLWKLDAPFIWGPVGGTQNYPWRFLLEAGVRGALTEGVRSLLNAVQLRFSPRVRAAARRAAVLLAANSTIQRDFEHAHGIRPVRQLETGVRSVSGRVRRANEQVRPLRLIWSGDLQPWKALSLLLKGIQLLPVDVPVELRVFGRGPLLRRYQRLAARLGVSTRIEWRGALPHREYLRELDWADVMVFTSLRDTSGNVVLEALAAGIPVVCLDHQGVRDIVTPDCGIKVEVTRPHAVIVGIAEAIARLSGDAELLERLSRGALERARDYLWSELGSQMRAQYERVLAEDARAPVALPQPEIGRLAPAPDVAASVAIEEPTLLC